MSIKIQQFYGQFYIKLILDVAGSPIGQAIVKKKKKKKTNRTLQGSRYDTSQRWFKMWFGDFTFSKKTIRQISQLLIYTGF
jgi:hypothetical protein